MRPWNPAKRSARAAGPFLAMKNSTTSPTPSPSASKMRAPMVGDEDCVLLDWYGPDPDADLPDLEVASTTNCYLVQVNKARDDFSLPFSQ